MLPSRYKPINFNSVFNAHACSSPFSDKDGVPDIEDNCKFIDNADQLDSDNDKIGNQLLLNEPYFLGKREYDTSRSNDLPK